MAVNILLVEDEAGPAILVKEALREIGIDHVLEVAVDGEAALAVLQTAEELPDLVLLDLNLPLKTGLEVLRDVKSDPRLRVIPVIIFSNSKSAHDIGAAYSEHCNAFLEKTHDFDDLVAKLKATGKFWFEEAVLPA